ncbi:hypothetical protein [Streptomyces sp. NPDC048434]|uniref:hypothetical protein n=1 Tax=Streptomyces sp. NPDC048434 TaxID=3365549 RepID=UPI00372033A5
MKRLDGKGGREVSADLAEPGRGFTKEDAWRIITNPTEQSKGTRGAAMEEACRGDLMMKHLRGALCRIDRR